MRASVFGMPFFIVSFLFLYLMDFAWDLYSCLSSFIFLAYTIYTAQKWWIWAQTRYLDVCTLYILNIIHKIHIIYIHDMIKRKIWSNMFPYLIFQWTHVCPLCCGCYCCCYFIIIQFVVVFYFVFAKWKMEKSINFLHDNWLHVAFGLFFIVMPLSAQCCSVFSRFFEKSVEKIYRWNELSDDYMIYG